MKINDAFNGASEKEPPTPEEIRLGTRTHVLVRRITLACTLVLVAIVAFVATQVPLNTTVAYNRLGSEFRLPVFALLVLPALLFSIWIRGRDLKKMVKSTQKNATCLSYLVPFSLHSALWLKSFLPALS